MNFTILSGSAVCRAILAKKKLLGVIGLVYMIVTLTVYDNRLFATLALKLLNNNLTIGDSWIDHVNSSSVTKGKLTVTKSYGGVTVDTHFEDDNFGHTGEIEGEYSDNSIPFVRHDFHNGTVIAIGTAITSKGTTGINEKNIGNILQVFTTFLPSFCKTVSPGYNFQFYFAYDKTDPVFTNPSLLIAFQKAFTTLLKEKCPKDMEAGIHFVQCSHTGKPTWAQNDAMLEAYLDNVDYFYRVNDDTELQTKGWVKEFVKTLKGYDPPNVGVVGPKHSGGNTGILTYDFVHRTHVDIFGFYYPKLFTDWWGDDWITGVYKPAHYRKLETIRIAHTMKLGKRYRTDHSVGGRLKGRLLVDKNTLNRFLERKNSSNVTVKPDGKRVIAMTLFGKDPKYTWGAIRNAQLMPIVFPQWILRFYVPHPKFYPRDVNSTRIERVPSRIISKLKHLGSDIVYIRTIGDKVPPKYWRYLITMDETVDYFLIRDVDSRITDRDSAVVNDWMQETDIPALHCVRDHPKHYDHAIVDGLWGGRTWKLRNHLNGTNLLEIVEEFFANMTLANYTKTGKGEGKKPADILTDILWPLLSEDALCHDTVSCEKWKNTRSFPVRREMEEYLGQKFDERQDSISADVGLVKSWNSSCYKNNV